MWQKRTLYTPHSTLSTPHFTLHTLHSTLYTPHFTLYTLHSTLYTLHFILHTLHCTPHFTFHNLHFTLCAILHLTLYTPPFTLFTLHFTLHTLWFPPHTLHCTLHTPQSPLHTLHTTFPTQHSTSSQPTICTPPSSAFHSLQCTVTVTGTKMYKILQDCSKLVSQPCSTWLHSGSWCFSNDGPWQSRPSPPSMFSKQQLQPKVCSRCRGRRTWHSAPEGREGWMFHWPTWWGYHKPRNHEGLTWIRLV